MYAHDRRVRGLGVFVLALLACLCGTAFAQAVPGYDAGTFVMGFPDGADIGYRIVAQFMSDIYNAIMRRGPDVDGLNFWIGQLDSGAQTREQVRQQFVQSPEFNNRVTNVINAGCAQH
jgi:hypothetical protein